MLQIDGRRCCGVFAFLWKIGSTLRPLVSMFRNLQGEENSGEQRIHTCPHTHAHAHTHTQARMYARTRTSPMLLLQVLV